MGQWSLMGGFIQENESADDPTNAVLSELTGTGDTHRPDCAHSEL